MAPRSTRSARARTSLPLPSSKTRSAGTPTASQPRRSRPLRQWRTQGVVDKQSTLTQIDFVRPLGRYDSDEEELDYEGEEGGEGLTLQDDIPDGPRRKRRKIEVHRDTDTNRRKSAPAAAMKSVDDEKENDAQVLENDDLVETKPKFRTPRKDFNREVCSSQSPTTPLSIRSTRRSLFRTEFSPLKNLSTNVARQPRLVAEDTYKTNDSTGLSLSRVASVNSEIEAPSKSTTHNEHSENVINAPAGFIPKHEILDSDAEISDTGTVRSLRSDRHLTRHNSTIQQQPNMAPALDLPAQTAGSEANIYKPPVSDDSKDEAQEHASIKLASGGACIDEEANTLDDRLLLKRRRTYSSSRRRSVMATVPSSSISLEELPEIDPVSPQKSIESTEQVIEVPSSPPIYSANTQPENNEVPHDDVNTDPLPAQTRSSPAIQSDSQKATVQLQQESQWQTPRIPSSQASTASISLSSSPAGDRTVKKQTSSSRQGWFFNALTDSQLLPDSIMNFELPRFPGMLRGRRHAEPEGEPSEEH